MISVVYFNSGDRNIMVGAFLMWSDAEDFIKNTPFVQNYKIAEVDDQWSSWNNIREGIKK